MRNPGVILGTDEWEIVVPVVFETPVSVAGEHDGRDVDAVVARDGLGRAVIPGTSWAGVLRSWCSSHPWATGSIWQQTPDPWGSTDRASAVTVCDSVIQGARAEIRDGIGIDRRTGTAARGVKFTREVITIGSTTDLVVLVRTTKDEALEFGHALAGAIRSGAIGVGAMRTRGLGRVTIPDGSTARLRDRSPIARLRSSEVEESIEAEPTARGPLVELEFETFGPLMVAAGTEGIETDRLPLTTSVSPDGSRALVIPGSSFKGALRSQAERIWRTVTDAPLLKSAADPNVHIHLNDQVRVDDATGPVSSVFGRAAEGIDDEGRHRPGRRGGVSFPDLVSDLTVVLDDETRGAKVWPGAADGNGLDHVAMRITTRVALDRWTGGAAKGLLFSSLEPEGLVAWRPASLQIDERVGGAGLTLLALVLRDLVDGWIPIGFGANRTGGEMKVTKCAMWAGTADEPAVNIMAGDLALPVEWTDAWQEAVTSQRSINKAKRDGEPHDG